MTTSAVSPPQPLPSRPPRRPLPPGACDTHAHVFGPFDRFPLLQSLAYAPPLGPFEAHDAMLKAVGLTYGVLVHPAAYAFDHSAMLEALARGGGCLRGIGVAAPDVTDVELTALHSAGVRGLRFTEIARGSNPPRAAAIPGRVGFDALVALAPRMRALGWHAVLWAASERIAESADTLLALGLPLVLDHMGYFETARGVDAPDFQAVLRLLRDGRVWAKLSVCRHSSDRIAYADVRPFHDALMAANPERLLWGSDWPFISLDQSAMNAGHLIDMFDSWTTDESLRRQVLVSNPAKLYGFGSNN